MFIRKRVSWKILVAAAMITLALVLTSCAQPTPEIKQVEVTVEVPAEVDEEAIVLEALQNVFGPADPVNEQWFRYKWDSILEDMAVLAGTSVDELLASEESFKAPIEAGKYMLIDTRTPAEYEEGHVPGAINIPIGEYVHRIDELPEDKDFPIFIYCRTDRRSGYAALSTLALGWTNVKNVKKAWVTWTEEEMGPITTGANP